MNIIKVQIKASFDPFGITPNTELVPINTCLPCINTSLTFVERPASAPKIRDNILHGSDERYQEIATRQQNRLSNRSILHSEWKNDWLPMVHWYFWYCSSAGSDSIIFSIVHIALPLSKRHGLRLFCNTRSITSTQYGGRIINFLVHNHSPCFSFKSRRYSESDGFQYYSWAIWDESDV